MKEEIIIPILKNEDSAARITRRETYSRTRDLQAAELNEAISARLAKEKEEQLRTQSKKVSSE